MADIKISVIVPVYNMEKYLAECLNSILAQTLEDIEIICVDDGSQDGSREILESYRMRNPNIVVIYQENQGAGPARNVAMDRAMGEYIAFMDADDYYPESDVLEELYIHAKEEKVFICGGSLLFEQEGQNVKREYSLKEEYCFKQNRLLEYKEYQFAFGYTRFIYQRSLLKKNGIHFPKYRGFQDPPFMVKAMICAESFYAVAKDTYVYRGTDKIVPYDNFEVVNGIAKGLDDILVMSSDMNFAKLHGDMAICIFDKYIFNFYKAVYRGNKEMKELLINLAEHLNQKLLTQDGRISKKTLMVSEKQIMLYVERFRQRENELWKKMQEFNNIVIYGAGKMGKRLCDYIDRKGYKGSLQFGVSYQYPRGTACGKQIRNISEYLADSEDTLVLVAVKNDEAINMIKSKRDRI